MSLMTFCLRCVAALDVNSIKLLARNHSVISAGMGKGESFVQAHAVPIGIERLFRRTCHASGGELKIARAESDGRTVRVGRDDFFRRGLLWELNMANRRNHSRHRGIADNFHGSSGESVEANASSLKDPAPLAGPEGDAALASSSKKIARARKLIADPGYPPKEVLNSIARLLADHLDTNGPS